MENRWRAQFTWPKRSQRHQRSECTAQAMQYKYTSVDVIKPHYIYIYIYKFYFPRPEHGANAGSLFCVWLVSYVDDGVSRAFPSNRRPRGFKTDAHVTTVEWSGKDDPRTLHR